MTSKLIPYKPLHMLTLRLELKSKTHMTSPKHSQAKTRCKLHTYGVRVVHGARVRGELAYGARLRSVYEACSACSSGMFCNLNHLPPLPRRGGREGGKEGVGGREGSEGGRKGVRLEPTFAV